MTNRRPILALIDGHALAFRAFHALAKAGLRASNGEATTPCLALPRSC